MIILLMSNLFSVHSVLTQTVSDNTKTTDILENLRRNLMKNNYDYISASDEPELFEGHTNNSQAKKVYQDNNGNQNKVFDEFNPQISTLTHKSIYVPSAHDDFYHNSAHIDSEDDKEPDQGSQINKTLKKYKMIKMKNPSRRYGGISRRLVQEEGDDGVSILNLDNRPFPEFRLPKSRRRYTEDDYEEIDDAEIE